MSSQAVEQAVRLLRTRLTEARDEITGLNREIAEIEGALHNLGYGVSEGPDSGRIALANGRAAPTMSLMGLSVAAAVKAVVESERGPWTPSLVRDRLAGAGVQGARSDAKFIEAIRTSFYQMRKKGDVVTDEHNKTTAMKFVNDFGPASHEAEPREANPDRDLLSSVGDGGEAAQPVRF